jgi:hypothetical protein
MANGYYIVIKNSFTIIKIFRMKLVSANLALPIFFVELNHKLDLYTKNKIN